MKDIFDYLYAHSSSKEENIIRSFEKELWFCFSNFYLIFKYSDVENIDIYEEGILLSDVDFSIFKVTNIEEVRLQSSSAIYYVEKDNRFDIEFDKSYSNLMYYLINKIKTIYVDAIINYEVLPFCIDEDYWGSGFPEAWEYGVQIRILKKYWADYSFYHFLVTKIDILDCNFTIAPFYDINKKIKDSFEIRILSSNTKIRRLGYLKILLNMVKEQGKIPVSKINNIFERYCQSYNNQLESYKNKKGNIIVTKTGNSAKPYIEMAVNLGLIHQSGSVYEVGKNGRVYNVLKANIDKTDSNFFVLSKFDISFFLEVLLKEDYCFLNIILEQASINPDICYNKLRIEYKTILLERMGEFIDTVKKRNISSKLLPLRIIQKRINAWKKPDTYMEHVLMSRLNWLYDMEIIELKEDLSFTLTMMGQAIFSHILTWNDIALYKIVSPVSYIDTYFMKMMNNVLDFQIPYKTSIENSGLNEYLNNSFSLFKTLAPNRVTFSLSANYIKYMMFWNYICAVDTENIKNVFESKQLPNYIYKYQEHYKDGYIQRR